MNEIETVKPAPCFDYSALGISVVDTDFLRSKEISMRARTYQVMIDNGRDLIEAKARIEHGAFGHWCKDCLGFSKQRTHEFMIIADEFSKSPESGLLNLNVNKTSLLLICHKDTPAAAKEEVILMAKSGKVTTKETEAVIEKNKEYEKSLEELQAKYNELQKCETPKEIKPDLARLIPRIKAMSDNKDIMPAMANQVSCMPNSVQESWLSYYIQKQSLENQKRSLQNQLAAETQKVADLEARPEPKPTIIEKEVISLDVQAKLKEAETALAKLKAVERSAENIRSDFNTVSDEKHQLEFEISKLKEQLKVNDPVNIDAAHAESFKDILEMLKNRLIRFEEDRVMNDHPMNKTWGVLNKTMEDLEAFSSRVENLVCINPIGE